MGEQVYFEDVEVDASIPDLEKRPSTLQLALWAAGSGDFYQIHYDKDFAIAAGLDGIIVHGALKHAFLGEVVHRWIAPSGRIKRLSCSYRGMDLPDRRLTQRGRVVKKHQEGGHNIVELEIWSENEQGEPTTPGTAVVTLPSRSSG